jgi:hypothetical protein
MPKGSIRNPDSRVAGNAQGRASEFYKGKTKPVYGTINKKAPNPKKKVTASGRMVSSVKSKPPVKKAGGR